MHTSLEPLQLYLTLGAFFSGTLSVFFFLRKQHIPALILLFIGGLMLRIMIASIDPFLHLWDEQFHALVAKNMMDNPFKPVLVKDPIIAFDFTNWTGNHTWLHKQPLYLWQMALSMKIFGINEFAVRLPSALLSAIVIFFIFRIGKIVFNAETGFLSAFLYTFSFMQLEALSGNVFTDHNDVSFLFYVTASCWACIEYHQSKSQKWIFLVGLFAGCAVLVKWLTGLLVYSGWSLVVLYNNTGRANWKSYIPVFKAFFVSCIVFVPWQLYILLKYPLESRYEFAFSAKHLFTPIEGHGGSNWYHFDQIADIYGKFAPYIILPSFLWMVYRSSKPYRILLASWVLISYAFFTFAATKMPLFTLVVSPLLFIAFGFMLYSVFKFVLKKPGLVTNGVVMFVLVIASWFSFRYKDIKERHTRNSINYRKDRINTLDHISSAVKSLPRGQRYAFINCKGFNHVMLMFYYDNTAFYGIPSQADIQRIKSEGYHIAAFNPQDLPDYIKTDTDIKVFDYVLTDFQ